MFEDPLFLFYGLLGSVCLWAKGNSLIVSIRNIKPNTYSNHPLQYIYFLTTSFLSLQHCEVISRNFPLGLGCYEPLWVLRYFLCLSTASDWLLLGESLNNWKKENKRICLIFNLLFKYGFHIIYPNLPSLVRKCDV